MPNKDTSRTVYATEAGRICPVCGHPIAACRCKLPHARSMSEHRVRPAGDGIVRVSLDKKGRRGSVVTLITGLPGSDEALKTLAAELKRRCGSGGTLKDGVIEIQGNHRDTLITILQSKGFRPKKAGG
jgi:translation initiation factor 1